MKLHLSGKVVVITGAGRGIGREIALAFAKEKAKVVAVARTQEEIVKTRDMTGEHTEAIAVQGDVTSPDQMKKVVDSAVSEFNTIDIWVNNAGVGLRKPFKETTVEDYDHVMDVNVKGVFVCTKQALEQLEKNSGILMNISSGAGKTGIAGLSVYSASKFAVIGFSEALARENDKIKVYSVCPGGTDTSMYRRMWGGTPERKPEDVAEEVFRLCLQSEDMPSGTSIDV